MEKFLTAMKNKKEFHSLSSFGERGVEALASATPQRTGLTASSWAYRIEESGEKISLIWYNTNINNGVNIAVILQYGHGTRNGGYVSGIDYINPAMAPIFQQIADDAWKEVCNS